MKVVLNKSRLVLACVYMIWTATSFICLASAFSNMAGETKNYSDGVLYLLLDIICLAYVFFSPRITYPKMIINCGLLLAVQVTGLLVAGASGLAVLVMRISFWLISLISLYKFLSRNPEIREFFVVIYELGFVALSIYIFLKSMSIREMMEHESGMNELYSVLLGLPLIFLVRGKLARIVGVLAALSAVVLSLKLTAIIMLILGILTYSLIEGVMEKGKVNPKLLGLFFAVLLVWILFPVINSFMTQWLHVDWAEKVSSSNGSGGSGRVDIWINVLKELKNTDIIRLFFGHGYNTVVEKIGFSAHNDFLEVLYDFGILGFCIYIGLYICLLRRVNLLMYAHDMRAAVLGMSLSMVFIVSMFSHLVIVPNLMVNCAFIWAVCFADKQTVQPVGKGLYING